MKCFWSLCLCFCANLSFGQHQDDHKGYDMLFLGTQDYTYNLNLKDELKYILPGLGLNIVGAFLIGQQNAVTLDELALLDRNDVNSFDRGATNNYSSRAQTISDVMLFTGATIPLFTLFSNNCRQETKSIAFMTVETVLITGGLTSITKAIAKRYRPFNYNSEVPDNIKLGKTTRLSFFSGHASVTSSLCVMSAKILTDLNPNMKNKGLVWGTALILPATIGYLRYEAGKHFPTDVITGYAVGAIVGYLIPTIHMSERIDLTYGGSFMSLTYQF